MWWLARELFGLGVIIFAVDLVVQLDRPLLIKGLFDQLVGSHESLLRTLVVLVHALLRFYFGFAHAALQVLSIFLDVEILFELFVLAQLGDRYDSVHWGRSVLPVRTGHFCVDPQDVAVAGSSREVEDVDRDFALTVDDFGLVEFALPAELVLSIGIRV